MHPRLGNAAMLFGVITLLASYNDAGTATPGGRESSAATPATRSIAVRDLRQMMRGSGPGSDFATSANLDPGHWHELPPRSIGGRPSRAKVVQGYHRGRRTAQSQTQAAADLNASDQRRCAGFSLREPAQARPGSEKDGDGLASDPALYQRTERQPGGRLSHNLRTHPRLGEAGLDERVAVPADPNGGEGPGQREVIAKTPAGVKFQNRTPPAQQVIWIPLGQRDSASSANHDSTCMRLRQEDRWTHPGCHAGDGDAETKHELTHGGPRGTRQTKVYNPGWRATWVVQAPREWCHARKGIDPLICRPVTSLRDWPELPPGRPHYAIGTHQHQQ